jgi:type II secretory pathway component PulF
MNARVHAPSNSAEPNAFEQWVARRKFKSTRADLYRSLAWVYSGKARPGQISDVLSAQVRRLEERGSVMATTMNSAVEDMRAGSTMADAMRRLAPASDVMTMNAYQARDELGLMFASLARTANAQRQMKKRIFVLIKPLAYLLAIVVMLAVFSFLLLPVLKDVTPIEKWPEYARWFGYMTEFIANHGKLLAVTGVALVAMYAWALPNWGGPLRRRVDHSFLFSWYRELRAADFLAGLAAQLDGGTKLRPALKQLHDYAEPYLADYIDEIEENLVSTPDSPLSALRVRLFHHETIDAIEILKAGASDPGAIIDQLGRDAYENAIQRVEAVAEATSSLFLIIAAVLLVWAFAAMTSPLADNIGKASSQPVSTNR